MVRLKPGNAHDRRQVVHSLVSAVHLRGCAAMVDILRIKVGSPSEARSRVRQAKDGAGNGIRTRDFDLGKVALYH